MATNWYNETVESALIRAKTTTLGLSGAESKRRHSLYGANRLQEQQAQSNLSLLLAQFRNPLIYILAVGALVSFFTGHFIDGAAISLIIVINVLIAFWQELKAKRGMEALKQMAAPRAQVVRSGEQLEICASELVPGDIVQFSAGDILSADVRVIEAHGLRIDEAALTGESEPVRKHTDATDEQQVSLGDQRNMAFMSTIVNAGKGLGVVVATGMRTEIGHIAEMLNATEATKTPMQKRMDTIAKTLMMAALAVVSLVAGIGFYYQMPWLDILNTSISLSVAAIPEGLPTIVSIVLTMGSTEMVRRNALARQLSAIETLGSTTVICSDKTGTLTKNQMQVVEVSDAAGRAWQVSGSGFDPQGEFLAKQHSVEDSQSPELQLGLKMAALCNDAQLKINDGLASVSGNPTEAALLVAATKLGLGRQSLLDSGEFKVLKKHPFDSTRKMSSSIVQDKGGKLYLAVKGAPDVLAKKAAGFLVDGELVSAQAEQYQRLHARFQQQVSGLANQALRTLAVAYKPLSKSDLNADFSELEQDVILLGVFGIIDPPRPEARAAIEICSQAGIRTVMITGDHLATATAIAKQLGIIRNQRGRVLSGKELDQMSDAELRESCQQIAVFARVTPEHKLRIVKALQAQDEVVAMTGDGVNDAPALRRADIGVAMGITGTSVARESSDLILLDDNFSTIVQAVRKGRQIFDNLRKFVRQALTANVGEVSVILLAFLVMGPEMILPLTPLMILWINLVSDGLPALALGFEPEEKQLMQRQPRKRSHSFFSENLGSRIVIRGLALGGISFAAFSYALNQGYSAAYAQTVAFTMLVFAQLWHLFDARSFYSFFRISPTSNRYLLLAVFCSALLSLLVVYSPFGRAVFGTEALYYQHLLMIIGVAALPTLWLAALGELLKTKAI